MDFLIIHFTTDLLKIITITNAVVLSVLVFRTAGIFNLRKRIIQEQKNPLILAEALQAITFKSRSMYGRDTAGKLFKE